MTVRCFSERSSAGSGEDVWSHLSDLLQLIIVFQEEAQVHEGNVHVWIPAALPVLLDRVLPAGEGVFVDLEQEELLSVSASLVMNTTLRTRSTLFLICLAESVRKMEELASLALILV